MNTAKQVSIDRYLVRPLVALLNIVVRIAGKILRLDHSLDKSFSSIAIAKYKGMGSIIQSTPLIKSLKEKHPKASIIYVSSLSNKAILSEIKDIDKLILLDDSSLSRLLLGLPKFLWQLARTKIDVFIDLEIYAHVSTIFATASLATNRFGYHLRGSRYRLGIYTHMIYYNPKAPMSQVYLQMGRLIGVNTENKALEAFDHINDLPSALDNKDYIVINPNASDLRLERRWSAENFISLSKELARLYPDKLMVFIGGLSEANYTQSLVDELSGKVINLAGKTSIAGLIATIKGADLLISNDTGPLHIAMAVGTQSIGLFGPCSPTQYDIPIHVKVIYKNVYCSPCVHEFVTPPCKGNNVCMQEISVSRVIETIHEKKPVYKLPVIYGNGQEPLGVIKRS